MRAFYRSGKPLLILCAANGAAAMVSLAVPFEKEKAMTGLKNGYAKDAVVLTEADMIEREIDERLEAELQAKRAAMRQEIASRMQREKDRQHYEAIAARGREVDAAQEAFDTDPARLAELDASREAMREKLAKADERFRAEQDERERALNAFRAKPRQPRKLDEHGFEIR